jgi:Zn-finger nucleic acid-binding protein
MNDTERTLICPGCDKPFQAATRESVSCSYCSSCVLCWVPTEELTRWVNSIERRYTPRDTEALRRESKQRRSDSVSKDRAQQEKTFYPECPLCGKRMNRKEFGAASGIVLKECAGHGVLVPEADLAHIKSFVARGGEIFALERLVQELREQIEAWENEFRRTQRYMNVGKIGPSTL